VTGISRPAGSVSAAVVELARRVHGDLREASVLVVGTGVMGEQAARTVATSGVAQLVVANRTYSRALDLANRLGGRAAELTMLPTLVANADIVISSTGAATFILDRFLVREAMRERPDRPLLLVDIAVPRDIDPLVWEIDNVTLRDIDDLQQVGAVNLEDRRRDVVDARRLVEAEVQAFERWLATREVVPTIVALRDRSEDIRQAEVRKAIGLMGELTDRQRVAVEAMSSAIVNKLLHGPITQLKSEPLSIDGRAEKVSIARQFFGLDDGPVPVGHIAHRRLRGAARRPR
jgi:glutamyl-tRNA reductase